ncbi:MAG: ferritin-like domain-containing protein [Haloechinothrix sp.]
MRSGSNRFPAALSRRDMLRYGALAALTVPLAACGTGYDDTPDPLDDLARTARADAEAARTLATAGGGAPAAGEVANAVARVRFAHADALEEEVRRANRPASSARPPNERVADLAALGKLLAAAGTRCRTLASSAPRYRAGLLGSVAAGCAAAGALSPELGTEPEFEFEPPRVGGDLDEDAVAGLQRALDTEHAAVWTYGLVTAFLPAEFDRSVEDAAGEHRERRHASQSVLESAGALPNAAEPAYLPPRPVDDIPSAMTVVITAESGTARAWRGVLERTDDRALRGFALDALASSAIRVTRWRAESGEPYAAVALPGVA